MRTAARFALDIIIFPVIFTQFKLVIRKKIILQRAKVMAPAAVVIVGGGILGASVAYHLAGLGQRGVVLLERLDIANAASCRAAGLVLQISSKPAIDRMCRATIKAIAALERELGESLDFCLAGTLRLAETMKSRQALTALMQRARQECITAEQVDAGWRSSRLPWLKAGPETLSVFFAEEGFIDAYRLTAAYVRAARQRGARIETGIAVHAIRLDSGRAAGLETSRGFQPCEKVVIAAGAWSNTLTMPLGVALPMVPTRSHFWVAAPDPAFAGNQPMTIHADAGAYTRPEVGGLLIGLQEKHSRTFDCRALPDDIGTFPVTEEGRQWDALVEGSDRLADFFPGVNDVCLESYVDGLSTYTPDGHFILGPIDRVSGLYVAAGCCGSGVMASGGIGEALARLILNENSPYDLSPFKPDRFGCVDPASARFQARCAAARAGKTK
jgi:4-methylaminobutanoate oxidase (formaldehyde-forming)